MIPSHVPHEAYEAELQIRWSDQDINCHVNNARVITLIEEARIKATTSWSATPEDHGGFPRLVRKMTVDYHRPIHYGPSLYAYIWVTRLGTSSFTLRHELVQEDTVCVSCEAVMVVSDPTTGRPTPTPEGLRAALAQALPNNPKGSA